MGAGLQAVALLVPLCCTLGGCPLFVGGAPDAGLARRDAAGREDGATGPRALWLRTPAGNETWYQGSRVAVSWSWSGDIERVDLTLLLDGTEADQMALVSGVDNSGEHLVTVGAWRSEQARLRITSTDAPAVQADSEPFLILPQVFSFAPQLLGDPPTLSAQLLESDPLSGQVTVGGVDTRAPSTPFTFDWGDSSVDHTWFNATHTYADTGRSYLVTVTAHYDDGSSDSQALVVRFTAPQIAARALPAELAVTIPDHPVELDSRFGPAPTLSFFPDSDFALVPRAVVEYVLTAAAHLQHGFCNGDVLQVGVGLQQVVLRDTENEGIMYSLWNTTPVALAANDIHWGEPIAYSALFHEMGHNFSLNSPARYHYGGRVGNYPNAIFSESVAYIFQHAAAFALLNRADYYGLEPLLAEEIAASARRFIVHVRSSFEALRDGRSSFSTWNDPATPEDETFDSFMTVAYKYFEHAEEQGRGYGAPLRRMMHLLQGFDEQWQQSYAPEEESAAGEQFRATLMVAALSYAFDQDLRSELRDLGFPVDDATYEMLCADALARLP